MGPYNNNKKCLFYGQRVVMGSHGNDKPASEVLTDSFPQNVLGYCENLADEWAFTL